MTAQATRSTVAFVMSTNYAGFTVLGLAMGRHSQAAFLGEPALLLRRKRSGEYRHRKFCSLCDDTDGERCPVWSGQAVERIRALPADVYRAAASALGHPRLLVDASKDPDWMEARLADVDDARCVHISKPVESFVASVIVRQPGVRRLEFVARDWVQRNREVRAICARHSVPYVHLSYERFASDFARTMQAAMAVSGLEYEAAQEQFWDAEHHYVKGNPGVATNFHTEKIQREPEVNRELYRDNHRRIFLDQKWRKLLSARDVDRLYALPEVAEESHTLGYSHPLSASGPGLVARVRARTLEPGLTLGRSVAHEARRLMRTARQRALRD